ncbi:formyltransferase family protein [Flavobacteriaceae bacterium]|nr:formyltransferase family protein [Flavobacteriaceae bacterium]
MRITILCTDEKHPILPLINDWINLNSSKHSIDLINKKDEILKGDILFLISCQEFISKTERMRYKVTLVIHSSDLPLGRGWSPHIWEIINGKSQLTVSLIKAEDKIDTGMIYKKIKIKIEAHELWDEINKKLFKTEIKLLDFAVTSFKKLKGIEQTSDVKATYYSKRNPSDSKINPRDSIKEQFNKIRVMDPKRYPAFFELNGFKYKIILEKIHE